MNNQQLAEAIVNKLNLESKFSVLILPLIAEFKKEVAGEAFNAGKDYGIGEMKEWNGGNENEHPDRETYINSL